MFNVHQVRKKINKEVASTFGEDSGKWSHLTALNGPVLFNMILSCFSTDPKPLVNSRNMCRGENSGLQLYLEPMSHPPTPQNHRTWQ